MTYFGFRTVGAVAIGLCMATPALAQGYSERWIDQSGLVSDRTTTVTAKLTIPFGGPDAPKRSADKARVSFGLDYGRYDTRIDRRLALGFTLDGDMLLETNHITVSQRDLMAAMSAEGEDGEKSGSGATPWIIGGALLVGGVVLAANELEDATEDTISCIIGAVAGSDECAD